MRLLDPVVMKLEWRARPADYDLYKGVYMKNDLAVVVARILQSLLDTPVYLPSL